MYEKQQKLEEEKLKASSSTQPPTAETLPSLSDTKSESSENGCSSIPVVEHQKKKDESSEMKTSEEQGSGAGR